MEAGSHIFTHNDTALSYSVSGNTSSSAPAILLVHGWTCDQTDWSFQLPLLLTLGFQILTLDLRGHGRSPAWPAPVSTPALYTPAAYVADAFALLAHLNITAPIIAAGHSMGGTLAAMMAVERPHAVGGLVLVDSSYYLDGADSAGLLDAIRGANAARAGAALAAAFEEAPGTVGAPYTAASPGWLKAWHRVRTWGVPAEVITVVGEELFGRAEEVGRWETAEGYLREGLGSRAGDERVPRLAVVAGEAKVEMEEKIGLGEGDRVEVLEEGHWLHKQGYEPFNDILEEWLLERGFST